MTSAFATSMPGGWLLVLLLSGLIAGQLLWLRPRWTARRAVLAAAPTMLLLLALALRAPLAAAAAMLVLVLGHGGLAAVARRARSAAPAHDDAAADGASVPSRWPRIAGFLIGREIGHGAMGALYLAHDPAQGRPVAIKTLALGREFVGEALTEARQRFMREAATARRLGHPNIVQIFDAGEAGDLAYLVMEFVPGHDLRAHTRAGQLLPMRQAVETAARIADALDHAHHHGVLHRDIKPANVMIDPATAAVKVTDFGLAQVVDSSRTRTGLMLGTPSFMAPEQMTGARVDGRADLYSLGVTVFQLLTGVLPHPSESMAQLMRAIVNEPAPDLRTLRPEVPERLAHVVARALEKRPEARYADAAQMAAGLRDAAADLPVTSAPLGAASSVGRSETELSRTDPRHNSGV